MLLQIELPFCKFPELILQNNDKRNSGSTNYFFRNKPDTTLIFNRGTCHASSILGSARKNHIFVTHEGGVEENDIDLIQFRGALTLGCSIKASKSVARMKIWMDEEVYHAKEKTRACLS